VPELINVIIWDNTLEFRGTTSDSKYQYDFNGIVNSFPNIKGWTINE
jgi:hypothetical protein